MIQSSIAFIGGGNMAASLIGGLAATGTPTDRIWVSDQDREKLDALAARFGIRAAADNAEAVRNADTVVLAVKPQNMEAATTDAGAAAREREPLVVSIAAGIRVPHIVGWLGYDAAVVRTMPNTPALVGEGATALFANPRVSDAQRERAEAILRAVGLTIWVDREDLLDAVTAVSGSGPAYYFLLMELMEECGVALGLERETARALTLQTAFGAARIAREGGEPPATLRARVTSPGGTTAAAIETLQAGGIEALLQDALRAARDRSVELGGGKD